MGALQKFERSVDVSKAANDALMGRAGANAKSTPMAAAHHFGKQQAGYLLDGSGTRHKAHPSPTSVLTQIVHQNDHHHA
jgi:hypothetical protein